MVGVHRLRRLACKQFHAVISSGARWVTSASATTTHPPFTHRMRHTYRTLPLHDANKFGGRTAYLREIGPFDAKKRGRLFKKQIEIVQWNVDMWCAQQSLRKRWKQRDWVVLELPFQLSPPRLQRVIPEIYTDVPLGLSSMGAIEGEHTDPNPPDRYARLQSNNVRQAVFDVEDVQAVLFGGVKPYPNLCRRRESPSTLDKLL